MSKERLEYLRGEIRAERISYGEIAELHDLIPFIDAGDVELLEWAGVPEFPEDAVRGLPTVSDVIDYLQQHHGSTPVALDTKELEVPSETDIVDLRFMFDQMDWRQSDA